MFLFSSIYCERGNARNDLSFSCPCFTPQGCQCVAMASVGNHGCYVVNRDGNNEMMDTILKRLRNDDRYHRRSYLCCCSCNLCFLLEKKIIHFLFIINFYCLLSKSISLYLLWFSVCLKKQFSKPWNFNTRFSMIWHFFKLSDHFEPT